MLKQSICVFWCSGEHAGCTAQPGRRYNLEQPLASDAAWHALLPGVVTLEEVMESHLGKGDASFASATSGVHK